LLADWVFDSNQQQMACLWNEKKMSIQYYFSTVYLLLNFADRSDSKFLFGFKWMVFFCLFCCLLAHQHLWSLEPTLGVDAFWHLTQDVHAL
jgi:hypothetical protein